MALPSSVDTPIFQPIKSAKDMILRLQIRHLQITSHSQVASRQRFLAFGRAASYRHAEGGDALTCATVVAFLEGGLKASFFHVSRYKWASVIYPCMWKVL